MTHATITLTVIIAAAIGTLLSALGQAPLFASVFLLTVAALLLLLDR